MTYNITQEIPLGPVNVNLILYILVFVTALTIVALLMFCKVKKTSCIYMMGRSFCLKLYSVCCCAKNNSRKVEDNAKDLQNLLEQIG